MIPSFDPAQLRLISPEILVEIEADAVIDESAGKALPTTGP